MFAFCPDCGLHNSLQILDQNLAIVRKMLDLAQETSEEVAERLVENALEDCVSAVDGFGRDIYRVHAKKSNNPEKTVKFSFQNLESARENIKSAFDFDISASVSEQDWLFAARSFQKRHLIAHKMGVVDEDYVNKTGDPDATINRKISVSPEDVACVSKVIREIGFRLAGQLH